MWLFKDGFYELNIENFKIKVSTKHSNDKDITYDAWLNQIHSNIIYIVKDKDKLPKGEINGDGIILSVKNVKARVKTADCYPVVLIDVKNQIGAILHIGWRGSYLRILERCIKILMNEFNSKNILAVFGPGICKNCYEVKENLFNYFPREYFEFKNNRLFLDILSFNLDILKKYGISDIILPNSCTYESDILYSHRKGEKSRIYTILEIL
ncbi:MAG: polyphenol oxidase family protein [candidate division WOR-3 bacterium]|nr:polyphenol oxidase family protein [candidate division WOR-3 bacterium]MCX7947464.1 polyphenol oxidase family protein [candidate division WOR-3 bacterium]MDW8150623.1 polyphenol oxidase family protein [candidate division WOR-3 bacterium]